MMKFRYALQQVFYTLMLNNFNFYFLLAPQNYPYELKIVDIDSEYLAAVETYLEEALAPAYFSFVKMAQEFDKNIFEWKNIMSKGMDGVEVKTGPTVEQRREFMNFLYDRKFLSATKEFVVNEWEINKVIKGEV